MRLITLPFVIGVILGLYRDSEWVHVLHHPTWPPWQLVNRKVSYCSCAYKWMDFRMRSSAANHWLTLGKLTSKAIIQFIFYIALCVNRSSSAWDVMSWVTGLINLPNSPLPFTVKLSHWWAGDWAAYSTVWVLECVRGCGRWMDV